MTTAALRVGKWDIPVAAPTGGLPEPDVKTAIFASTLTDWIRLPSVIAQPSPRPQMQARELLDWSGLSLRVLAEMLGITHPTLKALVEGSGASLTKKPEVLDRLEALHALTSRLAPFEIANAGSIARALTTVIDGRRISEIATSESLADAYLEALKVVAPRPGKNLRQVTTRRTVGTATVALDH